MNVTRRSTARIAGAALLWFVGAGAAASSGCVRNPPPRPAPTGVVLPDPAAAWDRVLPEAQRAAADGRHADAERALGSFAQNFPRSREAGEVHYWRALFRLDPANTESGPQQVLASLDAYLALGDSQPHRAEALVLRRTATHLRALADSAAARPAAAAPERDKARDEEMQKLRDELAKALEELERIRKRLAAPKP